MLKCLGFFVNLFTFKPLIFFHEFLYSLIILIKLKNVWGRTPQSNWPGEGYFQVLMKNKINFA